MKEIDQKWYYPLAHFTTHIVVGMLLFSAIAVSAFLLHLLVHWMEDHQLESHLVTALRWLTYFIMSIDILVFVVYSIRTTWKYLKRGF